VACACLAAFFPLYVGLSQAGKAPAFLQKAGALGTFRFGALSLSSHYLAAAGVGLCALYSALCLGFILYSFRKTVSSEIYFYAFWVLSIGLEVLRLAIFDLAAGGSSTYWQIVVTKALLFARYSGNLSLFASGLYAAGFRNEKLGTVVFAIQAIALGLATSMPINTGTFEPTLELQAGYALLNGGLALTVAIVTVANYLYAASSTGEASYRLVALGTALFLAGAQIIASRWNPLAIIVGFVLLAVGSWLYVSRLHSYYLWQ
jgi:hypothetical protein